MSVNTGYHAANRHAAMARADAPALLLILMPGVVLVAALCGMIAVGWRAALVLAAGVYATGAVMMLLGRAVRAIPRTAIAAAAVLTTGGGYILATTPTPGEGWLADRQVYGLVPLLAGLGVLGAALVQGYETGWRPRAARWDFAEEMAHVGQQAWLNRHARIVHGPEPDPGNGDAERALWEITTPGYGAIRLLDVRDGTPDPKTGFHKRHLLPVPAAVKTCAEAQGLHGYGAKFANYQPARRT